MHKPTMLIVLDGFGVRAAQQGNAVQLAHMPFWRSLCSNYPTTTLQASGLAVGLLPGMVGNSEVGHMTLGAGRIIPSDLMRLDQLIASGLLEHNTRLQYVLECAGRVHLLGLVSDGGVHSHERHLHALLKIFAGWGIKQIFIHAILDGRDVAPTSAAQYLERLEQVCADLGVGKIVSIQGRFYGMDRDYNAQRTYTAYQMLTGAAGAKNSTWRTALERAYRAGQTDEFIEPVLLDPAEALASGDAVLFFNVRPDRARQLTERLLAQHMVITSVCYDDQFNNLVLLERQDVQNTLLEVLAAHNKRVFVIAETEKYAHVTYFFQGFREPAYPGQERVLVPSIKAKNYSEYVEMSAPEITRVLVRSLRGSPADFYLVNYANADMVGHSGDLNATIKACEVLDQQLALLCYEVVDRAKGTLFIASDHGKAEYMRDEHDQPVTAHTVNPVPFVAIRSAWRGNVCVAGEFGLRNVASTVLTAMGLPVPVIMEQQSIVTIA